MNIDLPLRDATGLTIDGPHRFLCIQGRTGLNVTSLNTRATISAELLAEERGTLSLWFCPLEDLGYVPDIEHVKSKDPHAYSYPLVSDAFPARDIESSHFGLFWNAGWYPKLMAKFCYGRLFPPMDFLPLPWVFADAISLRSGSWYHVALTWDRPARQLRLFVNGMLAAHNDIIDRFDAPGNLLNIGNPCMVVSDLRLVDVVWQIADAAREFSEGGPAPTTAVADEVRDLFVPRERPRLDLGRDGSWRQALALSFTDRTDLDGWLRQGPQYQPLPQLAITDEGLLIQTPEEVAVDTRTYLWSPKSFEGDLWVEYEFRPESERGLSLLVVCASGIQREDFIHDHGLPKGGGMGTIIADRVRNYHWEYFRRVESHRADLEGQVLVKNTWQHPLAATVIGRLTPEWHSLRFVKDGPRLHGSIDGHTVFDVRDEPWGGSGPVFDFGRLALRQMYHTTMRYRNFAVWTRPRWDR